MQLIFSAAYSFGGNIQSIKSFDEESRREYSKWVNEISILLIQIMCVCVIERSYERCICLRSSLCNWDI